MPTHHGSVKTTVQLSVTDLERATTRNPLTKHGPATSESIRRVTQDFTRGSIDGTLTETYMSTKDKTYIESPGDTPLSTGFLGNPRRMPFFMVHAGKSFFAPSTKENRNRRPCRVPLDKKSKGESASAAIDLTGEKNDVGTNRDFTIEPNRNYKPPRKPHALCLTVFLSRSSFLGFEDKATGKPEICDVKINVYFNGAFCASYFVPQRYHGENHSMTEHIVRFTGRRIGRVIEKPWIIVPSGQKPDGSRRRYRKDETASAGAQQRWKDISDALMTEADKNGRNEKGERPISGEYLESLAQLSMPQEVEEMQKAGGAKFGIFDVVIIWGKGVREGREAVFIVEPTPMRNEGFTATNMDQPTDSIPVQNVPETTDSPFTAPKSKAIISAKSNNRNPDASTVSPLSLTQTQTTTPSTNTNPFPLKKHPHPSPHPDEPRKRKQTLEEQFKSITAASDLDPKPEHNPIFMNHARTTRSTTVATTASSPLSSAPTTSYPSPAQTENVNSQIPCPMKATTDSSLKKTDGEADSGFLAQTPASRSKRRERVTTQMSTEALDREFVTPTLSEDCVITYAPAGVFRNVGAAKERVFNEEGVVMGARFVVGG